MPAKRFNITLPEDSLSSLDAAAKANFTTRSAYIREAIGLKMRIEAFIFEESLNPDSNYSLIKAMRYSISLKRSLNRSKPFDYQE